MSPRKDRSTGSPGRKGPILVVAEGEDDASRATATEAAVERFALACGRAAVSEILIERFEGIEEFSAALRAASTPSLTGEPKAIVLECCSISLAEADAVCAWLEKLSATPDIAPDVLLVLRSERTVSPKVRKRMEGCGASFETPDRPSHQDLPGFVSRLAAQAGLKIAADAAAFLGAAIGSDAAAIRSAVSQLADAYPPEDSRAPIRLAQVQALFEPARHDPPWVLISAIERGDTAEALVSLEGFLDGGYHPLQVLAILYTSCRRIAYLASAEGAHREILASMKLPPGAKGRISKLSRKLGPRRARRLVSEIAQAELDMKGRSGLTAEAVLEKLVVRLCDICR